jgi:serine/threonine protein kinase/tetratricopeptide (TPR) repeat protein
MLRLHIEAFPALPTITNQGMSDPKNREGDSESPTLVPDGRSVSPTATRVRSQALSSDTNPITSRGQLPSDGPIRSGNGTPIPSAPSDAPTQLDIHSSGGLLPPRPVSSGWQLPALLPGTLLGGRYEILQTVGEGGMGAVYKAEDRELGRTVALKVIRPELASDRDILQRFKQEILLASKVTDRNIIRIYDLGDAEGVKFITMEFVEGEDLHHLLKRQGKMPAAEAVDIMEQVVSGLQAAHRVGIIHRDLKPGNIMRATDGRVLVMDFGLARSLQGEGMTRTGAMLGTMEYMSPEQAQAKGLDPRSDIFTIGLILYELLTGTMPYQAESAIASLLKRTQERAIPVSDIDRNVPGALSNIVSKCLERDPALRYQCADDLLADLRAWQGKGGSSKVSVSSVGLWMNRVREVSWSRIAPVAVLLVVMVAATAWYFSRMPNATVVAHAPVSVLVADFQNNTGDSLFDDTLEPMFNVALEGASFINAFNRGNARQLAGKLPNPTSKLDEKTARQVAVSQGVSAIVTGSLSNHGSGYRLSVRAIDAVTGKTLATGEVDAANKDDVLLQVPKVTAPIRKALGDTTPESVQLLAAQGGFTTSNLEAVHQYSIAMEQQSSGKLEEALQSFSKAAELDPNFARAYAGIAGTYGNLGQVQNADKYAKLAMQHIDRLTERERYRIRGQYYMRTENWQKCIDEYSELVRQYPADDVGPNNLALCYGRSLNMPRAMQEAQRALQLAPNDAMVRINFSLYACYASDFQSCERESRKVLQLNPSYEEAFLVVAYSQLGQNQLSQAAETYQKLEKLSPRGDSLAVSGLANLALYEGRFRDGAQMLEKGAAADLAAKNPDAAADKFVTLAYANVLRGDEQAAVHATESALANSQSVKIRFLAARLLVEAGEVGKARKLAASLASEIQVEPQAYAKLVLGEAALKEHNPKEAIQLFTEARGMLDTWIGRFDMGRADFEAGALAEADSEFDRCLQRRGEALEFFMDDMPTYSYLPVVYYFQGRVREGLKSAGFADSYRTYLSIRGKSTEDPLLPEIRRRLGQ